MGIAVQERGKVGSGVREATNPHHSGSKGDTEMPEMGPAFEQFQVQ